MALDLRQQEKQQLQTQLHSAIKQCQIRYGGKTELATELDSRVSSLCDAWELVLQHGLKHHNKALSTVKHVGEISGLTKLKSGVPFLDEIKNMETEPAFWHCVREHLSKHELERYLSIKGITTDAGRGRSWLRSAINEHTLERYLHLLLANDDVLSNFYEDWAFLRDTDRASTLTNMAAGLAAIIFALSIDHIDLNTIRPARGLALFSGPTVVTGTVTRASGSVGSASDLALTPTDKYVDIRPVQGEELLARGVKKGGKKKRVTNVVSFDGDTGSGSTSASSSVVVSPLSLTGVSVGRDVFNFFSSDTNILSSRSYTAPSPLAQGLGASAGVNGRTSLFNNGIGVTSASTASGVSTVIAGRPAPVATVTTTPTNDAHAALRPVPVRSHSRNSSAPVAGLLSNKQLNSDTSAQNVSNNRVGSSADWPALGVNSNSNSSPSSNSSKTDVLHVNDSNTISNSSKIASPQQVGVVNSSSTSTRHHSSSSATTTTTQAIVHNDGEAALDASHRLLGNAAELEYLSRLVNDLHVVSAPVPTAPPGVGVGDDSNVSGSPNSYLHHNVYGADDSVHDESYDNSALSTHLSMVADSNHMDLLSSSVPSDVYLHASFDNSSGDVGSRGADGDSSSETSHSLYPLPQDSPPKDADLNLDRLSQSDDILLYNEDTHMAAVGLTLIQASSRNGSEASLSYGATDYASYPVYSADYSSMSADEMREATVMLLRRKEELEAEKHTLEQQFAQQNRALLSTRAEYDAFRKAQQNNETALNARINSLTRENELLMRQLRKYVSAVQMLRRQGVADDNFSGLHLDIVQPSLPELTARNNSGEEVSQYEQKLIQVAEMHGELMEFNDLLRRQLLAKDAAIHRLTQQLSGLRVPMTAGLPVTQPTLSAPTPANTPQLSITSAPAMNISLWIPCAYLRGSGATAHHVYQVYVRIRDDEWNIYRRYSDFLDLHHALPKRYPRVASVPFPRKKTVGHKEAQFVEERRRQLQQYLRSVVDIVCETDPTLAHTPSKQYFIRILAFFGDDRAGKTDSKAAKTSAKTEQRRSQPPPDTGSQLYSGL